MFYYYMGLPNQLFYDQFDYMRKMFFTGIVQLIVSFSMCQGQKISYGDNAATGAFYNIRGIKIYCEIYGSGRPLLMIHGNGGSIKSFENNISYFSRKYKVIVADSRGQGKSKDANDSLSFEMMADDEAALLDVLHIDSAYVLGWSDGGINALLLAMRHPGKVIKLVSTGANLWPDSTAINPSQWKEDKTFYDTSKDKHFVTPREKYEWKLFLLDWLQPNIPLTALQSIRCPSLIIGGDHDLINIKHTMLIYRYIPKAYLWILPNSGHDTLIEYRDDFDKKVDDFFSHPYHAR
jgi:pimeloyl-ACP methyl ester carboxylesterase